MGYLYQLSSIILLILKIIGINYIKLLIGIFCTKILLYPYDISPKATNYKGPFKDDSIYLFKGYDKKYHLHALEIAQFSLSWIAWRNENSNCWSIKRL